MAGCEETYPPAEVDKDVQVIRDKQVLDVTIRKGIDVLRGDLPSRGSR